MILNWWKHSGPLSFHHKSNFTNLPTVYKSLTADWVDPIKTPKTLYFVAVLQKTNTLYMVELWKFAYIWFWPHSKLRSNKGYFRSESTRLTNNVKIVAKVILVAMATKIASKQHPPLANIRHAKQAQTSALNNQPIHLISLLFDMTVCQKYQ